jgi:hypothetical protein
VVFIDFNQRIQVSGLVYKQSDNNGFTNWPENVPVKSNIAPMGGYS